MVWQTLESKLSTPRMSRYLQGHQGEEARAAQAYLHNMKIAESLVSVFHVLEVALRNGIQKEMALYYGRDDWYEAWDGCTKPALERLYDKVREAKAGLAQRRVAITPDNLVAELSFGFWTTLFNRATIQDLSKPLMKVFFHCPKTLRRPDLIRTRLNNGRDLRNRCFHHEPLLWQPLFALHRDLSEVIKWIDPALFAWIQAHDRFPQTCAEWGRWKNAPVA
ncbi:hypothetical protein [Pseudomonas gingeri]